ncbi:MAG: hypothetical protein A2Y63_00270 [Candidatus Riflebacteria bacterium RBG_13_59_9]|nr:MAG: hypothetical protein A2Y63_00270 [Candidatus Riflebacteria bacterium RBG_13_59_9]
MGTASISITTTGPSTPEYAYREVESGVLTGIAVVPLATGLNFGQCMVIAGVMRGGRGDAYVVATFLNDYVSDLHRPYYPGPFTFVAGDTLYIEIVSAVATSVRLNADISHSEPEG